MSIIGKKLLGSTFVQDPKQEWAKINGVCVGESPQYGYMSAVSKNIGQLLDRMLKDQNVVVVVYNIKSGAAYIKKGCNINDPSDSKANKDFVSFVVKSRVNITLPSKPPPTTPSKGFVTARDGKFYLDDKEFKFVGPNAYWLGLTEGYNYPPKDQVTEIFEATRRLAGNSIRSHTLGHSSGSWNSLRPKDNNLNNNAWEAIDYAYSLANKYDIKIIAPLTDCYKWYNGNYGNFCETRGIPKRDFWTNMDVRADFKKYIFDYLNHFNNYTQKFIKDDTALGLIELGNELGNIREGHDSTNIPTKEWLQDISSYVKSIDKNHLVLNPADECLGQSDDFNISTLDCHSGHFYWADYNRMNYGAEQCRITRKPYVVGEYSSFSDDAWYREIEKRDAKGSLFWSIYPHSNGIAGGDKIPHGDGYTIHYSSDNQKHLLTISNHFRRLRGMPEVSSLDFTKSIKPLPVPVVPTPVVVPAPVPVVTVPKPVPQPTPTGPKKRCIYYHANWSMYARNYQIKDIPEQVTDISYAFFNLNPDGTVIQGDSWADTEKRITDGVAPQDSWNDPGVGFYGNFGQIKKIQNSGRKLDVSLSVGGWTWSKNFSPAVSTPATRTNFVNSVIDIFKKYTIFSGISVDWEYVSNDGVNYGNTGNIAHKDDCANLILFLIQLRNALNSNGMSNYTIAMCTIADPNKCKFDLENVHPHLDEIHIMTYDFHDGAWGETTSKFQCNPRKSEFSSFSCEEAADYYLSRGVPSTKLFIGAAFYSRGYNNTDGIGKPASGGSPDKSWDVGSVDYKQLPLPGATEYNDPISKAAYSYDPVRRVVNTYDNTVSVIEKCKIIYEKNLGGCIVWESSADYPYTHERSLMKTFYNNLTNGRPGSLPVTQQPTITPTPVVVQPVQKPTPVLVPSAPASNPVVVQPTQSPSQSGQTTWVTNYNYTVGTKVTFNGVVYVCIQPHTSLAHWTPDSTASLWSKTTGTPTVVSGPPPPTVVMPTPISSGSSKQWSANTNYEVGQEVFYTGFTYACIQAHTSLAHWTPDHTASLWTRRGASAPPVTQQPSAPTVGTPVVQPTAPVITSPNIPGKTIIAPYSYNWSLGNNVYAIPDLKTAMSKINLKAATSAFITGDGALGLSPSVEANMEDMKAFINAGNILILSVGGANGPFIQDTMDKNQMVNVLSNLLDRTGSRHLDFDIEGSALPNVAKYTPLNEAIVLLQKKYAGLYVSYTIPVGQPQWGSIEHNGMALLKNAKKAGVDITVVNAMIMDIFSEADWGVLPVKILENMHQQLKAEVFPEKSDQQIYRMLGATPMIGTDDMGAIFSIEHAKTLATYAKEKNIGLVSYWSLQRDQVGTGNLGIYSQQNSTNFQYYNTFKSIIG